MNQFLEILARLDVSLENTRSELETLRDCKTADPATRDMAAKTLREVYSTFTYWHVRVELEKVKAQRLQERFPL